MKSLAIFLALVVTGYAVVHHSRAGRLALARIPAKPVQQAPARNQYSGMATGLLEATLDLRVQVAAELRRIYDTKPQVIGPCGKLCAQVLTPEAVRQMMDYETEIPLLRAELATRTDRQGSRSN